MRTNYTERELSKLKGEEVYRTHQKEKEVRHVRKKCTWHAEENMGASDKRDKGGKHGVIPADEVTSVEAQQQRRK
jgi:hypothetical protein